MREKILKNLKEVIKTLLTNKGDEVIIYEYAA